MFHNLSSLKSREHLSRVAPADAVADVAAGHTGPTPRTNDAVTPDGTSEGAPKPIGAPTASDGPAHDRDQKAKGGHLASFRAAIMASAKEMENAANPI